MTAIRVHVASPAGTTPVGTAQVTRVRGVETTEFTYDQSYLSGPGSAISPDLPLTTPRPVLEGLPGALADSAPDAWGRNLITRQLASRARNAGHVAPTPTEVDFLLGVNDLTRQGALRLRLDEGDPFLAEGTKTPPLLELDALLDASRQVAAGIGADDAIDTLLAAGSGSLGGARPKASVTEGASLQIAKFPHPADQWEVMRWEAVALELAAHVGLRTPTHRLLQIGRHPVLLLDRFDRHGANRIPYLSATSLIGAREGSQHDYLELVDALTDHGSDVKGDLVELWRRIAFSVAINNTDDHLRNHGFLHRGSGWTLSPVFDVNPDRRPAGRRVTSIGGATHARDSLIALHDTAPRFGLERQEAEQMWHDLLDAISPWRDLASQNGISDREIEEFAPVLDYWSAGSR